MFLFYFWERDTHSESRGGAERDGDRIRSRLQALSCQHRARCGAQTHRLQDHDLSQSWTLNRLSHPGAPSFQEILSLLWLISLSIIPSSSIHIAANGMISFFIFGEGDSMSPGGAERERHTESEAGSRLWIVSTGSNMGLKLTDCKIMTWAKVRCLTNWATRVPCHLYWDITHIP